MNWWVIVSSTLLVVIFLLVWYIKRMLRDLLFASDNIGHLLDVVKNFSGHLQNVHAMEAFYGEPVIQELVEHSKVVVEEIGKFEHIYTITDALSDQEGETQGEETFEEKEESEEQQSLLHQRAREGDNTVLFFDGSEEKNTTLR